MATVEQIYDFVQENLYGIKDVLKASYHQQSFNCEYHEDSSALAFFFDGGRIVVVNPIDLSEISDRKNGVECFSPIGAVSKNDIFDLLGEGEVVLNRVGIKKFVDSDCIFMRFVITYDADEVIDHIFGMIIEASLYLVKVADKMKEKYVGGDKY